jgi:hypothetical protein
VAPSAAEVDDEFDSSLPTLQQIFSAPVVTLLHVPKILRTQWTAILADTLEDFLTTCSRAAFQRLMLLPKCLFAPLPRAGANKRLVPVLATRFRRWQAGELEALWADTVRRLQKSPVAKSSPEELGKDKDVLPPTVVRQVEAAVAEGAYSKGLSLLSATSRLALADTDTLTRLRALHPQGTPLRTSPPTQSPFGESGLTAKQVLRELRSFKPLSAPGPSGLRHTHLLEAAEVPSPAEKIRFKKVLVQRALASASGGLPSWCGPWLAGAKLIPLLKPCGGLRLRQLGKFFGA